MIALRDRAAPATRLARMVLGHQVAGPLVRTVGPFLLLWLVLRVLLASRPPPLGIFIYGGVVGLLYALVAFGLILIYRANRIINFANAEIGAAAATLGVLLIKSDAHVPYPIAFAVAVSSAVVAGAVVEYVVIRRFVKAPRLILSVATIGVGLIFAAIQFYMPDWITGRLVDPSPPETPLSGFEAELWGVVFDANSLVIVIAVGLVCAALTLFFRYTDVGLAVRASAENADRAALLGIPVKRVSTVVWVLASAMAALGVFLRAPVIGLPIGALVGPSVLLFGLAAAVMARMEKFTVALGAAVALGILEQTLFFWNRDPSIGSAIVLPLLLIVMLTQRTRASRSQDAGVATWSLAKEFRPVPPELRHLPEVSWGLFAARALVILAALLAPLTMDVFQQTLASVVLIYGIVGISLVVLIGWAGQISLGQWGFVGVGAATAGGLASHTQADFFVSVAAAGVVGAVAALVIGIPALRIQGLYLAVSTLAFAIATQVYLLSPSYAGWLLPERARGIGRPSLYGRFDLADDRTFYYVTLIALVLALLSARSLRNSRTGRTLVAVRDNARGAQSYGISVARARLTAFAISGFWAGLAGGLFVYHQGNIDTLAFAPSVSLDVLVMVVIGGLTSLPGALLGTLVIGFFKYGRYAADTQFLATGAGVLVILLLLPGGLAQLLYGARDALLRKVAERRRLHVPSLVADSSQDGEMVAAEAAVVIAAEAHVQEAASVLDPEPAGGDHDPTGVARGNGATDNGGRPSRPLRARDR